MSEASVSAFPASFGPAAAWPRQNPSRLLSNDQRAWLVGIIFVLAGLVAAKTLFLAHAIACHGTGEHLRQLLSFHA